MELVVVIPPLSVNVELVMDKVFKWRWDNSVLACTLKHVLSAKIVMVKVKSWIRRKCVNSARERRSSARRNNTRSLLIKDPLMETKLSCMDTVTKSLTSILKMEIWLLLFNKRNTLYLNVKELTSTLLKKSLYFKPSLVLTSQLSILMDAWLEFKVLLVKLLSLIQPWLLLD